MVLRKATSSRRSHERCRRECDCLLACLPACPIARLPACPRGRKSRPGHHWMWLTTRWRGLRPEYSDGRKAAQRANRPSSIAPLRRSRRDQGGNEAKRPGSAHPHKGYQREYRTRAGDQREAPALLCADVHRVEDQAGRDGRGSEQHRLEGCDAGTLVETFEHVDPNRLSDARKFDAEGHLHASRMNIEFEELAYRRTPLGELILRRRTEPALGVEVFEVKLGDAFLMSSLFTAGEIALANLGLAGLGSGPLDVVVGGLGLGYTARAVLGHPAVRSLLVVEALRDVIDWHRRGLVPLGAGLSADRRCEFLNGDFFALVDSPGIDSRDLGRRFHAILVDIDHSPRQVLHPSHAAGREIGRAHV